MLRGFLKHSIKFSMIAYDKIKVGLIQMKETIEDVTAEAKSEIFADAEAAQQHMSQASNIEMEDTTVQNHAFSMHKKDNIKPKEDTFAC